MFLGTRVFSRILELSSHYKIPVALCNKKSVSLCYDRSSHILLKYAMAFCNNTTLQSAVSVAARYKKMRQQVFTTKCDGLITKFDGTHALFFTYCMRL